MCYTKRRRRRKGGNPLGDPEAPSVAPPITREEGSGNLDIPGEEKPKSFLSTITGGLFGGGRRRRRTKRRRKRRRRSRSRSRSRKRRRKSRRKRRR